MQLLLIFIVGAMAIDGSIFYIIIRVRDHASSRTNYGLCSVTAAIASLGFFWLLLMPSNLDLMIEFIKDTETRTFGIAWAMSYVLGCIVWPYIAFKDGRKFFQERVRERLSD